MNSKAVIMDSEQADSLRELGNIGVAYAATILSSMLSAKIRIQVPEIALVNLGELYAYLDTELAVHVIFQIQGDLDTGGYVILHIPRESAIRLIDLMMGSGDLDLGPDWIFTEMDNHTIDEIGNAMIAAFFDGCAKLLHFSLVPSSPTSVLDIPHAVMESLMTTLPDIEDIDDVVLFKTELICSDYHITTTILLLPSEGTLELMLERLQQVLSDEME